MVTAAGARTLHQPITSCRFVAAGSGGVQDERHRKLQNEQTGTWFQRRFTFGH